jgi:CubicO group peptidase (beta-lactamase class C family)
MMYLNSNDQFLFRLISTAVFTNMVVTIINLTPGPAKSDDIQGQYELLEGPTIAALKVEIPRLMDKALIPGMSIAFINDGELAWLASFGVRNASTKEPVTNETVFEGASLGKCVFSYAVMKLAQRCQIDIDKPILSYITMLELEKIWEGYNCRGDPRILDVTPRMILSHSTGFPNWPGSVQEIQFDPGTSWSYSGSGFVFLGEAIKKITGFTIDEFVEMEVFKPLNMTHSHFVWCDELEEISSFRHNRIGRPQPILRYTDPLAAGSLYTTARDYAKFILAILNETDLDSDMVREVLQAQVRVDADTRGYLHWGLGFGLNFNEEDPTFWHAGDNGDAKAYFEADKEHRDAIVYFANGRFGLSIAPAVVKIALGVETAGVTGEPFAYAQYDFPEIEICQAYVTSGATGALEYIHNLNKNNEGKTSNMLGTVIAVGREALYDGDVPGARVIARAVSMLDKDYTAATVFFGEVSLLDGNTDEGLELLKSAIVRDSGLEGRVNSIGYTLLERKMTTAALKVFKLNTKAIPGSWNAWNSYAEAWLTMGDTAQAVLCYEKSLDLNPDNGNAMRMLKKLDS